MRVIERGVLVIIGLLVGGLGSWALRDNGETYLAEPPCDCDPERSGAIPSSDRIDQPVDAPSLRAGLDACLATIAEANSERDFLQQQLALLGGTRSEWPPSLDDVFTEASIRSWLAANGPEFAVGTLEALDCNEFPCIALFRLNADSPASSAVLQPLSDAFADHTGDAYRGHISIVGTTHGVWGALVLAPDLAENGVAAQRTDVRLQELSDEYTTVNHSNTASAEK